MAYLPFRRYLRRTKVTFALYMDPFKMHLMCCTPVERLANLYRKNKVPGIRDYLLA